MEISGKTVIKTQRTVASFSKEGYEYSVNNQNGEMRIDAATVEYDKQITNGIIMGLE